MSETSTIAVGGMTCTGCSGRVRDSLEALDGVLSADVSHETGLAVVSHSGTGREAMLSAITMAGYVAEGELPEFDWGDRAVWKQSAHNTKWCLVGCSIGDFGTIAAFQFIPYFDALGWSTMSIMLLAMFNGIMTSIALETFILSAQMALKEAFRLSLIHI